jgi:hypothetical protein
VGSPQGNKHAASASRSLLVASASQHESTVSSHICLLQFVEDAKAGAAEGLVSWRRARPYGGCAPVRLCSSGREEVAGTNLNGN